MRARTLPLIGVLAALCLFVVAGAYYPGGTLQSRDVVGYDWTRHYISTLFPARALNGMPNPSRYAAIPAMLLLCTSVSVVFKSVSMRSPSRPVRKTIEIAGIGSMVYAFLAVTTRMHDLLVTVSLIFFLVALAATLRMLYAAGQTWLFLAGLGCLAILLGSAVIYYGHLLPRVLAVGQKLGFAASTSWLLALYFLDFAPQAAIPLDVRRSSGPR